MKHLNDKFEISKIAKEVENKIKGVIDDLPYDKQRLYVMSSDNGYEMFDDTGRYHIYGHENSLIVVTVSNTYRGDDGRLFFLDDVCHAKKFIDEIKSFIVDSLFMSILKDQREAFLQEKIYKQMKEMKKGLMGSN